MNVTEWKGEQITEPGIYFGMPLEHYHSKDVCDGPSISATGLKEVATDSPYQYWAFSPYNPDKFVKDDSKKSHFSFGRAVHALVLGDEVFSEHFKVAKFPDYKKVDARDWRDRVLAGGRAPLLKKEFDNVRGAVKAVKACPDAMALLDGQIEHSIFWKDAVTGVWLRSRPDVLPMAGSVADLKTIATADFRKTDWAIQDLGYWIQLALVGMAMRDLMGQELQTAALVFVEKSAPYHVFPRDIDPAWIEMGEAACRRAINVFAHGIETGEWPSRADRYGGIPTSSPPKWMWEQHEQSGVAA